MRFGAVTTIFSKGNILFVARIRLRRPPGFVHIFSQKPIEKGESTRIQ